jgi:hypothetical protein
MNQAVNNKENNKKRCLRGTELRYVLTLHLFNSGPATVTEMANTLAFQGFRVNGRVSKTISDALRWERGYGRVRRLGRGRYGPAWMPRSTEYRIHKRVMGLRAEVDALREERRDDTSPAA